MDSSLVAYTELRTISDQGFMKERMLVISVFAY